MEILFAILCVPVLWIISEQASRHTSDIFARRRRAIEAAEAAERAKAIEPVKIETPRDRYEKNLEKLKDLPLKEEERELLQDELRLRFIDEIVR